MRYEKDILKLNSKTVDSTIQFSSHIVIICTDGTYFTITSSSNYDDEFDVITTTDISIFDKVKYKMMTEEERDKILDEERNKLIAKQELEEYKRYELSNLIYGRDMYRVLGIHKHQHNAIIQVNDMDKEVSFTLAPFRFTSISDVSHERITNSISSGLYLTTLDDLGDWDDKDITTEELKNFMIKYNYRSIKTNNTENV